MRVYIIHSSAAIGILGVYANSNVAVERAAELALIWNLNGSNYESCQSPLFVAKWQDGARELFVEGYEVDDSVASMAATTSTQS